MDQTLPLPSSSESAEDTQTVRAEIDRCLDEMDRLREEMHLNDIAIAKSRRQTEINLKDISQALTAPQDPS